MNDLRTNGQCTRVVLDHDYLKVPADRINDIKPLITIVGGKLVYQGGPL